MDEKKFLKAFKEEHKKEMNDLNKIQEIIKQIKEAESSKQQYFTQVRFNSN